MTTSAPRSIAPDTYVPSRVQRIAERRQSAAPALAWWVCVSLAWLEVQAQGPTAAEVEAITPLPLPLVCAPEALAGAETRVALFPHLGYTWAIRNALAPITIAVTHTSSQRDQGRALEYLNHRNRTQHGRRGTRR